MNTYRNAQYTITTSLNDRTIHIKLVNNISYMCYEGNFDAVAFKLSFDIKDIFELVKRCFAAFTTETIKSGHKGTSDDGFNLQIILDNTNIQLIFQCVVAGFLHIAFDIRMREKLMSNDAQLTINFQRIEQKNQEAIDKIMKRMEHMETVLEALGHADICFTEPPSGHAERIRSFPITTKKMIVIDGGNHINKESFKKIKYFYQLEELTLNSCQWQDPQVHISNSNVKKLHMNSCGAAFADPAFIKNFPKLQELHVGHCEVNSQFVTMLRSLEHNIQKFTFRGVTTLNQAEMQTYCTQNGIELSLA